MISTGQLKLGRHWSWTYYKDGDLTEFYSAEIYTVVEVSGSLITIEIQSKYSASGEFKANTRFRTDISKCYQAFGNPEHKKEFTIDLFPMQDGQWATVPYQVSSNAFEEKFNCNPAIHSANNSLYETRFDSAHTPWGEEHLFQQWPREPGSQIRAFYFEDEPELKGIAYRKDFNPGTSNHFIMLLNDWGD
jgi:hypothetical protein